MSMSWHGIPDRVLALIPVFAIRMREEGKRRRSYPTIVEISLKKKQPLRVGEARDL